MVLPLSRTFGPFLTVLPSLELLLASLAAGLAWRFSVVLAECCCGVSCCCEATACCDRNCFGGAESSLAAATPATSMPARAVPVTPVRTTLIARCCMKFLRSGYRAAVRHRTARRSRACRPGRRERLRDSGLG